MRAIVIILSLIQLIWGISELFSLGAINNEDLFMFLLVISLPISASITVLSNKPKVQDSKDDGLLSLIFKRLLLQEKAKINELKGKINNDQS